MLIITFSGGSPILRSGGVYYPEVGLVAVPAMRCLPDEGLFFTMISAATSAMFGDGKLEDRLPLLVRHSVHDRPLSHVTPAGVPLLPSCEVFSSLIRQTLEYGP